MANWTKNQPNGSATRRKWNIDNRTSLNNLKYHIASEGCSDVQYDLAKELLQNAIDKSDGNYCEEAVHWLMRAAQEGHEEAAKLLQKCYDDDCGITSENEDKVRSCLSMTPGERAARKAARELFACLSNGNEHITPKQLERKMRQIYKLQKKRRRRGYSTSTSDEDSDHDKSTDRLEHTKAVKNGEAKLHTSNRFRHISFDGGVDVEPQHVITEENLVSAAVNYSAGRLPTVSDALTLSVPHPATLDHVPCFHRLLFHPIIFFTLLYHRLINSISTLPFSVPGNVRILLLFLIYSLLSSDNAYALPTCIYYICIGVMMWSTCKMLKSKQDFVDFRIWSGLFLSYGNHNIEADISENRFLKNNMKPYVYFFCGFICSMIVYPLVPTGWIPHSELTIISGIFVFVSLLAFMYCSSTYFPDWITLISFGINVLAKYPYEMDEVVTTGWRFLDLKVPNFSSFVIGNGIEFCLNCRTALYLLIPGFLTQLAKRSHWNGVFSYLIPHCVTLCWLHMCISSSQSATMFGVMRATLGLAGILLFLPLFGIVSLLIPVFVAIDYVGVTNANIRFGSTVLCGVVAVLGSCFMALNRTTQKYVTMLQVLVCLVAACVLTYPYMTSNFKDESRFGDIESLSKPTMPFDANDLSWQRFFKICDQSALGPQNRIKKQLRCATLDGIKVTWVGTVSQVQISRASNKYEKFISKYLPNWLGNLLRCSFGTRLSSEIDCDFENDPLCSDLLSILKSNQLDAKCTLNKYNVYEYEVLVKMSFGLLSKEADVVLQANYKFNNFTQALTVGDRIHFHGTLLNSRILPTGLIISHMLGSTLPHVQLIAIECIICKDKDLQAISIAEQTKSPVDARRQDLMRGIKYLLNTLLNPLITIK
ncbi:wolframin isoform X2 [Teleopsis dalmanni]|uniref:wolframin isoform X2 n=1 Tax=Teleopsis dalmanni TaxID=139649 RepID=UPI0018CF062E|nr:wolframin isoform X2 [Teleopsis dalmanni]